MQADAKSGALEQRIGSLVLRRLRRETISLNELKPGLGHRRFFRIELEGSGFPRSLVARVEGPSAASNDPLIPEPGLEPIRAFLDDAGLPVPRSYGTDQEIQLLEDLGDENLETLAARSDPLERYRLYSEACGLIPRLQKLTSAGANGPEAFQRRWNRSLVASKAAKWLDWGFPLLEGRVARPAERRAITGAFDFLVRACESSPLRLAHRDFQSTNLLWTTAGAAETGRLVMIDLQGALLAPPEYDLVCLLRDPHVALDESEVQNHLSEIRSQLPDRPEPQSFLRRFDLITLARVCKDVSHYLAAASQRNDRRYLRHLPNAMDILRGAAIRARSRDPELAPLAELIERAPTSLVPAAFAGEQS